jgi:hypothetical protein
MFNKVYMEGIDNVSDEEKLLNFCKMILNRIDMNKKFKKTDKATLLKLLNPNIPEKTFNGYRKNNATWKEDSLLRIFDDSYFNMFLTGLKIQADRLDPDDDPTFSQKFDYRYMDAMIRGSVREIKELKEEIEDLKDTVGIPEEKHISIVGDLQLKNDRLKKENNEDIKILEEKLETQRKHFEYTLAYERKDIEKRRKQLEEQFDKMMQQ